MSWRARLIADPLPWLLEPDIENPGVRFFALRDLVAPATADAELRAAQAAAMAMGPVPAILAQQSPDGSWPATHYRSTTWQVMFLAELGADPADARIKRACDWMLDHIVAANGGLAMEGRVTPSGVVHCHHGYDAWALLHLDPGDARVATALDWQVRAILGEGDVRYFKSTTAGPGFVCGVNQGQPCGWGAVKAARALGAVPPTLRSPMVERAREATAEFLLGHDLAVAAFPYTGRVSSTWFKFGFPSSYWADVLEAAEAAAGLGYAADPRLAKTLEFIVSKQGPDGRWALEHTLNGKTWINIETKRRASKWVTLRALRVLKAADGA